MWQTSRVIDMSAMHKIQRHEMYSVFRIILSLQERRDGHFLSVPTQNQGRWISLRRLNPLVFTTLSSSGTPSVRTCLRLGSKCSFSQTGNLNMNLLPSVLCRSWEFGNTIRRFSYWTSRTVQTTVLANYHWGDFELIEHQWKVNDFGRIEH